MVHNAQMKDIPTDGMVEDGRIEDYQVLVRSRIRVGAFKGIRKSEIDRFRDGNDCGIIRSHGQNQR